MARSYKKIEYDGYKFDSKSECEFYKRLVKLKESGNIKDFKFGDSYIVVPSYINWRGKKERDIKHIPDYEVTLNDDTVIIIDTKGGSFHTTDAKIKRKLWERLHLETPYYYVSVAPKYLFGKSNMWVESTVGNDFLAMLKKLYDELYPNTNKRKKGIPCLTKQQVQERFKYHNVSNIFLALDKKYTKKERDKLNK